MIEIGNGKQRKAKESKGKFLGRFLLLSVAFLGLPLLLHAQAFSPPQVRFLAGPGSGAEYRIQLFYHYLNPHRDPSIVPPAWLAQVLPAMSERAVWKDPEEGILNEAQLWQAPAAVLYEFFEITKKTYGPKDGGTYLNPAALIDDYSDNYMRFQMSLDRLHRASMEDSMAGRGRALLSDFDLVDEEMASLVEALANNDVDRYRKAVMTIGELSDQAFHILEYPPRGSGAKQGSTSQNEFMAFAFKILGLAAVFAAAWWSGVAWRPNILAYIEKRRQKIRDWAYEYERQFLTVKMSHLVGGPALGGALIGLLTFNPYGFFIFAFLGVYGGLNLPGWLLNQLKLHRGMKCEAQLMDMMILMSNGLKSGVDLVQCLELVSRDLPPPISEEVGLCLKNYQLGTPLERALEGIEERVYSRLVSYMIKAIVLQRSVGGNLTKIFDRIVENIREESKLVEKTSTLTAQQRLQGIIVAFMPWAMLLIMFLFQTQMMESYYFTPLGALTLVACVIWISIGMQVIRKMGEISI